MLKYGKYSFSKIDLYLQCPFRFYIKYILKPHIKVSSFYLEKGNFVHGVIESILKDDIKNYKVPKFELLTQEDKNSIFKTIINFCSHSKFKEIKRQELKLIEENFYLNERFQPCEKSQCIIKGKIDLIYTEDDQIFIYDWKTTGQLLEKVKQFPKKPDQLELYAIWGMQKYELTEALCNFAYVDVNYYDQRAFVLSDLPALKHKWIERIDLIETTKNFTKNKTKLCDYCENQEFCDNYNQ